MEKSDFEKHLKTIVDKRVSVVEDSVFSVDEKKEILHMLDRENDELNQSLDIFFRLVDFEGFTKYSSLLDSLKAKIVDKSVLDTALSGRSDIGVSVKHLAYTVDEIPFFSDKKRFIHIKLSVKKESADELLFSLKGYCPSVGILDSSISMIFYPYFTIPYDIHIQNSGTLLLERPYYDSEGYLVLVVDTVSAGTRGYFKLDYLSFSKRRSILEVLAVESSSSPSKGVFDA